MPVKEASSEETPYGRYVTSDGWFVLNLGGLARGAQRGEGRRDVPARAPGGAVRRLGARVRVVWPGEPNALYHSEGAQEGFLVLSGRVHVDRRGGGTTAAAWDYFHCPADTRHVMVGAGEGPCAILMIGARPEVETLRYPVSDVAARYGASAAKETDVPDEAYADWPGEYLPARLPWPLESDAKGPT